MSTAAVIVAAGSGARFGGELPKQFHELGGMPLLARSVWAFDCSGAVDQIVVALPADWIEHAASRVFGPLRWRVQPELVTGGTERGDSVARCLEHLRPGTEYVLVHDGARPLASPELVCAVAARVRETGAAVAAVPERSTLKRVDEAGRIIATVDRRGVWQAQTPQGFRLELLRQAYARARERGEQATDDSGLVEALGHPVSVVTGEESNIKVTTECDLRMARCLLPAVPHREALAC